MKAIKQVAEKISTNGYLLLIATFLSGVIAGCEYCVPPVVAIIVFEITKMFMQINEAVTSVASQK